MPWVGFEPTIPVFKRAKTVHALDPGATVIGTQSFLQLIMLKLMQYTSNEGFNSKSNIV
jgi:hypothetical protein